VAISTRLDARTGTRSKGESANRIEGQLLDISAKGLPAIWTLTEQRTADRDPVATDPGHDHAIAWSLARAVAAQFEFMHALLLVLAFTYAGLAEVYGLIVSVLLGPVMLAVGVIRGIVWLAGSEKFRASGLELTPNYARISPAGRIKFYIAVGAPAR
jgi:hypothetical protein